jgi:hypothetical protein
MLRDVGVGPIMISIEKKVKGSKERIKMEKKIVINFDLCEDQNFSKRNKYKQRITYLPSNLTTITN